MRLSFVLGTNQVLTICQRIFLVLLSMTKTIDFNQLSFTIKCTILSWTTSSLWECIKALTLLSWNFKFSWLFVNSLAKLHFQLKSKSTKHYKWRSLSDKRPREVNFLMQITLTSPIRSPRMRVTNSRLKNL